MAEQDGANQIELEKLLESQSKSVLYKRNHHTLKECGPKDLSEAQTLNSTKSQAMKGVVKDGAQFSGLLMKLNAIYPWIPGIHFFVSI